MKKGDRVKVDGKEGVITAFVDCYDNKGKLKYQEAFVKVDGAEELFDLEKLKPVPPIGLDFLT